MNARAVEQSIRWLLDNLPIERVEIVTRDGKSFTATAHITEAWQGDAPTPGTGGSISAAILALLMEVA
jgi:hypothetical protein